MGYVLHSYLCAVFYTLPWKIQPIRVQESNWILNGITSNIPIMPLYFLWQLAQNSYSTLSHGILVNLLLTRGEGWGILAQGCDSMDWAQLGHLQKWPEGEYFSVRLILKQGNKYSLLYEHKLCLVNWIYQLLTTNKTQPKIISIETVCMQNPNQKGISIRMLKFTSRLQDYPAV